MLEIKNLHVTADNKKILKGLTLTIKSGEIHAIMGPNGSGKSTLLKVIMGHPKFKITKGSITLNKKSILKLSPDKRVKLGLFLGFQHPIEIPGVHLGSFLRQAKNENENKNISPMEFRNFLSLELKFLKIDENFIDRGLNEGLSGGERKKTEILQMVALKPKFALLDEIDSGLDIDSLKTVAIGIKKFFKKTHPGILLVTHYQRILSYITPDFVHIIHDGKIVKSGTKTLAYVLEKHGYEKYIK